MFEQGKKLALCAAAAAALTTAGAAPADAAMSCWNESQVAAARVRDLQSRLMVDALRCRAFGIDILGAYNEFVRSNRATIQAANIVILGQFTRSFGSGGQSEYDRFTTALANAYGGNETSGESCAEAASVAEEAVAANGDIQRLVEIEQRFGAPPPLPGGQCPIRFETASIGG
ncbi:MAG TPA: hypothetical protein VF552_08450 [Allosphingosinicella sp.]|jgi:hypothetical protein